MLRMPLCTKSIVFVRSRSSQLETNSCGTLLSRGQSRVDSFGLSSAFTQLCTSTYVLRRQKVCLFATWAVVSSGICELSTRGQ